MFSQQPKITSQEEAKKLLPGSIILDVRKDSEYEQGHIKNSLHIPHDEIPFRLSELNCSKEQVILLYCASGVRSEYAKEVLINAGYKNSYNVGGFAEFVKLFEEA